MPAVAIVRALSRKALACHPQTGADSIRLQLDHVKWERRRIRHWRAPPPAGNSFDERENT